MNSRYDKSGVKMPKSPENDHLTEHLKQLESNEKAYRAIAENSPDLLYRTDLNGKIIYISRSVFELSGYTNKEAIGMDMAKEVYLNPEERDTFLSLLQKNGRVQNFEARLRRKDGSTWWASTNAHFYKDSQGNILGVEGITRDISELKAAEAALRESEAKMTSIFRAAPIGIGLSVNRQLMEVNDFLCSMVGYSRKELLGKNARILYPSDEDYEHIGFEKYQQLREKGTCSLETRFRHKNGSILNILMSSTPIDTTDFSKGVTFTAIDVTLNKKVESALRESEKQYRQLFDHAPAGIYEIDLKNNQFINVNEVMCRYSGYSKEEFLQLDTKKLLGEDITDLFYCQQMPAHAEYKVIKKDGGYLPVAMNIDFVIFDGEKIGARVVVNDITEQKRMEALLIQSEKMMSVGGLAAGMAHEINNPLAGMMLNAQVALRRVVEDLPANRKAADDTGISLTHMRAYLEKRGIIKALEYIHDAGATAAAIVENMLSFSRKSSLIKKDEDLPEIVDKAIELAWNDWDLNHTYDVKKIKIIREYEDSLPTVWCEKSKIQQVLFNIIKNASEAMGMNAGPIESRLIIRLMQHQGMARIEIEDNGPGMDAQVQKRIFEPFFTTRDVDKGTGLGLSVSYFIVVDDHQGKLEVDSAPGKGTTFMIQLPLNQG